MRHNCQLLTTAPPARPVIRIVRPTYSYMALCDAMRARQRVTLKRHDGTEVTGMVNGIRAEDGSGKSWLIDLCLGLTYETVYVRTN